MHGNASLYPADSYALEEEWSMPPPAAVIINAGSQGLDYDSPLDLRVSSTPALQDLHVAVEQNDGNPRLITLAILIDRPLSTQLLDYSIAISLLLLCPLIFHALFFGRESERQSYLAALLNIAVVILAIVPLRQMLVPVELQGSMTRIDTIFGLSATLLLASVLARYGHEIGWDKPIAAHP